MEIRETDNYDELMDLFFRNGLEITEDEPVPTDIIKGWRAELVGRLVGGCVLSLRQGDYIIDGIAIEPAMRQTGLGAHLLNLALEEAKSRGADSVYLVAKAPNFFRKQGFLTIDREEAPLFFECFTCPQYLKSCFPEVMKYRVNQ
jgi:N-acetylglutamate synthase-like GNAT family acetyltransferase